MRQLLIAALVLLLPAAVQAELWSEDFDSYANGQVLDGTADDGGWKGWDNNAAAGASVTEALSLSAPNSVDITGGADLVHELSIVGGVGSFTAWQYIPSQTAGTTYFILLNRYNDGGPYNWSVQLSFDLVNGLLEDEFTGDVEARAIVFDRWVQIRVNFDLVNDTQSTYYDGTWLSSNTWTRGEETGQLALEAVDLYANNADSVYYDDLSLVPEPSLLLLSGLGLLAVLRRKR